MLLLLKYIQNYKTIISRVYGEIIWGWNVLYEG